MNAYSSIERRRTSAGGWRLRSRAYRAGIRSGLSGSALFFEPRCYERAASVDVSVGAAWKNVGDAIKTALGNKGGQIGEDTGKTDPSS